MTIYNITLYNDMGQLLTSPEYSVLPRDISDFVYTKAKMYLNYATDTSGLGCRFYILKPELNKNWSYFYNGNTINIVYDTDTFNSNTMRYI